MGRGSYPSATAAIKVDLDPLHGYAESLDSLHDAGIGHDTLLHMENVIAGDYDDMLIGNSHDNIFTGGGGNDTIEGGGGYDTAVYSGDYDDYDIQYDSSTDTFTITDQNTADGDDGTDTVSGIDLLRFADGDQDLTPPVLESHDAATPLNTASNIVIQFSEDIQLNNTGLIEIHSGSATGAVFESFNLATDVAHLSTTVNTLTINPDGNLAYGTDYYVTFADGSVLDLARNPYDYEDEDDAFHFSTLDAAVAASGGSSDGLSTGAVVAGVAGLGLLAFVIF